MNHKERQKCLEEADSLAEALSFACDVSEKQGQRMVARINGLEKFFENKGHSRAKPKKMAILYVMMRYGHTTRTVEKWWGSETSSYWSFSAKTGQKYLEEIKEIINESVEHDENSNWTPGDKVYESREDPLNEYFDIDGGSHNSSLSSF